MSKHKGARWGKGECATCHRVLALNIEGRMRAHQNQSDEPCEGSHEAPAAEAEN